MINITELTVIYPDEIKAVDDLTLFVEEGERVAIVGENGAGKSTLLLSVVGIVHIARGSITVDGTSVTQKTMNETRRKVGMVFQNPDDQLFMAKVYDDVAFAARSYGIPEYEVTLKVNQALKSLNIEHLTNRMPHRLSSGEKRQVAIAGIIAMQPSAILLDEPSSFLDPRSRKQLMHIIAELPHTLIIATHDLDMAMDICSRVVVLKNGKIAANGTPKKILTDKTLLEECGLELPLSLTQIR